MVQMLTLGIFFITGTSGSGKSTLVESLRTVLSKTHFAVYDFDEVGVPEGADETWRKATTEHWLKQAIINTNHGITTIVCGVCKPSEIVAAQTKPAAPLFFGFLKLPDKLIRSRLLARGWPEQLINDNIIWAKHLEADVTKQTGHCLFEQAASTNPHDLAATVAAWVMEKI